VRKKEKKRKEGRKKRREEGKGRKKKREGEEIKKTSEVQPARHVTLPPEEYITLLLLLPSLEGP
jgi:hypothetical protein